MTRFVLMGGGRALACVALAAAAWLALAPRVHAQGSSATIVMTADRTDVAVGETFELTVKAEVRGRDVGDVQLPDLDPFRVVQRRVSRPMQFRFGFGQRQQVVQATTVHRLTLEATEAGQFEIEPARVRAGGRTHSSNPITVVVGGSGAGGGDAGTGTDTGALQPPPGAKEPAPGLDGARYDRKAFLRTVVDKAEPWHGEQVTVTVYLYAADGIRSAPRVTREPSTDGLWVHDLLPPSRSLEATRQTVRGRTFRVYVLRRFAAFPLKSGELTIGPMEVHVETGSVFDVLGRGRGGPVQRKGMPVTLEAQPLPDESRQDVPVGRYSLETKLDRSQVPTGDAVTVTATVEGTGNVKDVRLELPDIDGLRILQPETHEDVRAPGDLVQGTRTFEWLVVPEEPGDYELPSLGFDYFDPAKEQYAHAGGKELVLTAAGRAIADAPADDGPSPRAGGRPGGGDEPSFGPIRSRSELTRTRQSIAAQPWFPLALAFPPVAWLGVLGAGFARRRMQARSSADAPRRATRAARKRLAKAEEHAQASYPHAFYAEIGQALKAVLEARLGEPLGGFTHDELRRHLCERGMEQELADRVIDELEGSEFARFSAAGVSSEEMEQCLGRTRALMDRLDKFEPTEEDAG